jgi:putative flippase GtrA
MQFFLYLIVGGLSFWVDIGAFVGLRLIDVPVIPASIISFLLATVANYLLSILLAFERGRFRRQVELLRFMVVVLVGLGLNTFLVWVLVYPLSVHPTAAKVLAVPFVLVWNYLGRRLLVFSERIPHRVPLPRFLDGRRETLADAYKAIEPQASGSLRRASGRSR